MKIEISYEECDLIIDCIECAMSDEEEPEWEAKMRRLVSYLAGAAAYEKEQGECCTIERA